MKPYLTAVLLPFTFPLGLMAQGKTPETPEENPFFLKTVIVVTATRDETELEKSPASTSIVTGREMQVRNVQLADQGINLLEGLFSSRSKGAGDTTAGVGMRGFAGRGSGQSRVLVLLDGEPLNDAYTGALNWQTLLVSEIDRVEVVRGPFSALYGGNAMGGVVNILTRPVEKRSAEISAQYGSHDTTAYWMRFSDRFWNRLGLTLGYRRLQTGGYPAKTVTTSALSSGSGGTPVTGVARLLSTNGSTVYAAGDSGDNWWNQHAWRARGEYTINSSTTVFFQFMRQRYGYGYDAYHTYVRDSNGNPVDSGTLLFSDGGAVRRISLKPGTFLDGSGGGYSNFYQAKLLREFTSRQRAQISGGFFDQPSNYYVTPATAATLAGGSGTLSRRPNRSWHGDAQWSWVKSTRHSLLAGTEVRREVSATSEFAMLNYALPDSAQNQTYFARGRSLNEAVYGQDQVLLTERLRIIAGGRIDYWKTEDGANDSFGSGPSRSYADRSRASASGKLSSVFRAVRGMTLRASVGTAFRNPTVYDLYRDWRSSTGTLYLANPLLEPEELLSWEAGVRQSLSERLVLEATYYENRITNLIYRTTDLVTDPTGKTLMNRNAGKGRTRGLEFSAKARLFAWLQLRTGYSFTNALITENPAVPASVGKRVPHVPRTLASATLMGSHGRWSGSLTGRYAGRFFSTDTNTDVMKGVPGSYDPYFEAGAALGCDITRHFNLYGSADNLLDRRYYQYYLNPGRVLSLGLRVRL